MGTTNHGGDSFVVGCALVLDSAENLERFITLNLRKGLDHLIVFLDDPDNPLPTCSSDPGLVTVVRLDADWWGDQRPERLNRRQRVVANLARVALTRLGWADWLVFLDGDEVALLDRDVVESIPAEHRAFRLFPLEAVSDSRAGDGLFKKRLPTRRLRQLEQAGLIGEATNASYFHGHATGKIAVRPAMDVRFHVHTATDAEGEKLPRFEHPRLRHLHFESPSPEEFVRKWTALAESGSDIALLTWRRQILDGFRRMPGLAPEERERLALELYDEHVREDAEPLERLGVLTRVDLDLRTHEPARLDATRVAALAEELTLLAGIPKRLLFPGVSTAQLLAALD